MQDIPLFPRNLVSLPHLCHFFIPVNATLFLQGGQWSLTLLLKSCICNATNRNNLKSREPPSPRAFEFPFIALQCSCQCEVEVGPTVLLTCQTFTMTMYHPFSVL